MAGHVDDIVDTPEDSEVTVLSLNGTVAGEIRPVAPVLALRILVVFLVVRFHEAIGILPDRLHDSGPRIANADVARLSAWLNLFSLFVEDHRMDSRHARTGAARLHRVDGRLGAAQEAAVLGLPPRVDDDRVFLADDVVIPAPDLGLDRLADRYHQFEFVIVFRGFIRPNFPQ